MLKHILTGLFCLALGTAIAAPADRAAEEAAAQKQVASMQPQQGHVTLPGSIATLDLPPNFRYLTPQDTDRLLVAWGNPPGAQTLGMIVPADVDLLSNESWGVVVTYDKDGHVKDDDADGIDYAKLLKEMQEGSAAANAERKKQGYPGMQLAGWAEPPHYDKAAHKLYWAKDLLNEDSGHHGLNYNIRVLGREGVLVLNAVADMGQLGQIRGEMQKVTAFTNFTAGNRYADFNEKTDKVAEYGIAALVAGGVAAKLGLFAKLAALLLAFKKLLVVAVAAIGSAIWKLFKRKPKDEPVPAKVDLSK
ncbi:Uncharacterized membrane-anchored protein [Massilia sp. PDC64]|nr:DUF2167 domain-containing protein [Massilia sp. PDC64]SDC33147.1 Uncharacterized membrane-anchored protein [Massilia sp. PDC64]